MKLTLKQLLVFKIVAQCGNLSQAAGQLFMTKGAVSQTLGEVENRLDIKLFGRHHGRLFINHEGRRLLPLADELLTRVDDIDELFSTGDPSLRLGGSKTIGGYLLPSLLSDFQHRYGWLPEVVIDNSEGLRKRLLNFELDLALIEGEVNDEDLQVTAWRQDEIVIICPAGDPLAQGENVPLSALEDRQWILRETGSGSRNDFEHQLAPLLTKPKIVLALEDFDAILFCVQQRLGLTFASRLLIDQPCFAGHFSQIPTQQRFFRTLSLCHHRQKYLSDSVGGWIRFLHAQRGDSTI
ncbi:LysR substrate-binding domain-containing protein [Sodalis sp. (in: enterobacteria)]|uniref:LysR substrate-binding domain-containing protein n=1 Tax=Sodalis sp. (in: enterobacteria) TaxID=1898979 RepID=UPI003F3C9875